MDSVDNNTQAPQGDSVPEQFGATLASGRRSRGLDVRQMAERLRQTVTRVRQMESGRWDLLGPPVYVRGYVVGFAKELGLNVDETDGYFAELEQIRLAKEREATPARRRRSHFQGSRTLFAYVAATALVAIPVASWLIHAFQGAGEAESGNASPPLSQPSSGNPAAPQSSGQPLLASMTGLPEISREAIPTPGWLLLHFNEDAWLEAEDQQGAQLAFGLMTAGSEQRLPTGAGLVVRLGNPDGVVAQLNGEAYDLSAHSHEDLAEFAIPANQAQ